MSLRALICALLVAVASVTAVGGVQRQWEAVDRLPGQSQTPTETIAPGSGGGDDVVTVVAYGHVYVDVRQATVVKLYTILGQLVSQKQLQPGVYRFKVPTRGIYLLKSGTSTRRITL